MKTLESTLNPKFKDYVHPEVIVDTEWVAQHLNDPNVRIIESNEDVLLYYTGHVPNAVHIDWFTDLQDDVIRDYVSPEKFAELCSKHRIAPETKCVFYGDKSNWWACYAFWAFHLFGHTNCAMMDGGRTKWFTEERFATKEVPSYPRTAYPVPTKRQDDTIRAFFDDTLAYSKAGRPLIDVRSLGEYRGEITHMPEYPQEGVLRGGHVPGARHCPWARAANEDGTFKTFEDLKALYGERLGLKKEDETIVYCRIGERSSYTWFVLTFLLGFAHVRNYDGSWTEWGNRVRSPITKGEKP